MSDEPRADDKDARAARAAATLQTMKVERFVDLDTASAFLGVKPSWLYEAVRLQRVPS